MKTLDEIKKAVSCCINYDLCGDCPYLDDPKCFEHMQEDFCNYINKLEY